MPLHPSKPVEPVPAEEKGAFHQVPFRYDSATDSYTYPVSVRQLECLPKLPSAAALHDLLDRCGALTHLPTKPPPRHDESPPRGGVD